MKTIKQDESIARSRFVDCPVCKNHTLKLKRIVQVGRCKSCNETYKVIVVFVKTGKKPTILGTETQPENRKEDNTHAGSETLPSWELPSDTSLFGSSSEPYAGLSDALFGKNPSSKSSESGSNSSGQ